MTEEATFNPNDTARAAFKAMHDEAAGPLMERFFELWEAEGDPRRAGSMAAHAYIRNAARIAVFGARCGGHEPDINMWLDTCQMQFNEAFKAVAEAFLQVAVDEQFALPQAEDKHEQDQG